MARRAAWVALLLMALAGSLGFLAAPASAAGSPIVIVPVSPGAGGVEPSATPTIVATYADSAGTIDPASVVMVVDGVNVTGLDTFSATSSRVTYQVPTILRFHNGNHTVMVQVADGQGHRAQYSWGFTVNTAAGVGNGPLGGVDLSRLILYVAIGAAVVGAAAGGWILYLKRTRRFTFRKYFATHPVKKEYLVLYTPLTIGFLVGILGLLFIVGRPGLPQFAPEYVLLAAVFVGLTAYAVDARREKQRIRAYERAFAQFLFELADAMRGGIDPQKAVVELAKTQRNILTRPLRVASDGIRVGRPFEDVLRNMAAPMRSPLVIRYAGLIADASTVGGETSAVVYRAAKDMDDFVKIEMERGRQLLMPVAVLYIAYGVLIAVLLALLYIAPSLGSISFTIFSSGGGGLPSSGGHSAATVPSLSPGVLKQRFFDLSLIVSLGTGAIIGAFTEGRAKYGLLHSLGLLAGTAVIFFIVYP